MCEAYFINLHMKNHIFRYINQLNLEKLKNIFLYTKHVLNCPFFCSLLLLWVPLVVGKRKFSNQTVCDLWGYKLILKSASIITI